MLRPVMLVGAALAVAGCGGANAVSVERPRGPIFVCVNARERAYTPNRPCIKRFNVAQLVGRHLPSAEAIAKAHGYFVSVREPLKPGEAVSDVYYPNGISVVCSDTSADCTVVRYLYQG